MNWSRRQALVGGSALMAGSFINGGAQAAQRLVMPTSFRPGEQMYDTKGKLIQIHGSYILAQGGTYYWYGENKEFSDGKNGIWTFGIRCYRSKDLLSWEDMGLIIPPNETDPTSPLNPRKTSLDRPHIIYNKKTKKYVCWIKQLGASQFRTVLTADKLEGPWTLLRKDVKPLGMNAGDFDLTISPDDDKAYMIFQRVHSEMICADLTDDYTDFTGYYSTHMPQPGPPDAREGPAYFKRGAKHYLITSGTTGYFPNPSMVYVADTYHGPWTLLGDLTPDDRSRTTFNSQVSCVLKHPTKKDLYIAIADRWEGPLSGPDFESGAMSRTMQSGFAKLFGRRGGQSAITPEEAALMRRYALQGVATSQARLVWLPLVWEGERPFMRWRDNWSLSEFV